MVAWFLATALSACGAARAGGEEIRWPYPLTETEHVIGRWLVSSGLEVTRASASGGIVRLRAARGAEQWELLLRPCSALATCVELAGAPDSHGARSIAELRDRYRAGAALDRPLGDHEVPVPVLGRRRAVVCLEATKGGAVLRSSGFVAERSGRVLTTAHDLEGVQTLTVTWADGTVDQGTLIRADRERDLALIGVGRRPAAEVPLQGARAILSDGEQVFSVGCPTAPRETIRSGRVRAPMRRVKSQPLWQVEMETLSGSSGSPVFDASGNLAGVVKGRFRGTEDTGFLIPVETVRGFLGQP